jgi:uncharacterized protein DUF541
MPDRRPARPVRRLALPAILVLATAVLLVTSAAASAQAPAPQGRTITAVAAGRVEVPRDTAKNSKAIGAAVEAARDRAVRLAITNARDEATRLATAGGLTLGALVSVAEPTPSPFFGGPVGAAYGADGTFGPGKFCGTIRTPIRRRNAAGQLRTIGTRSRFGCRIPGEVVQTVSATFAVS